MFQKNKLIVFEEINGEFVPKKEGKYKKKNGDLTTPAVATSLISPLTYPLYAFADTSSAILSNGLYHKVMILFDNLVPLVIVFAAGAWALGHRTRAINTLIGVCCGYLLAKNAIPIRDFLKGV